MGDAYIEREEETKLSHSNYSLNLSCESYTYFWSNSLVARIHLFQSK